MRISKQARVCTLGTCARCVRARPAPPLFTAPGSWCRARPASRTLYLRVPGRRAFSRAARDICIRTTIMNGLRGCSPARRTPRNAARGSIRYGRKKGKEELNKTVPMTAAKPEPRARAPAALSASPRPSLGFSLVCDDDVRKLLN